MPKAMLDMTGDEIGLCMSTSSCGRMPSLHQKQSACGESRVRYCEELAMVMFYGRRECRYPMIAVLQKTAVHNSISLVVPMPWRKAAKPPRNQHPAASPSVLLVWTCEARSAVGSRAPNVTSRHLARERRWFRKRCTRSFATFLGLDVSYLVVSSVAICVVVGCRVLPGDAT